MSQARGKARGGRTQYFLLLPGPQLLTCGMPPSESWKGGHQVTGEAWPITPTYYTLGIIFKTSEMTDLGLG